MRKNFGAKHLILPQPVYILGTYNEDGTPNAMNAAWGGISGNTEISVCIGARHRTTQNLLRTGAFTVSPGVGAQVVACDYFGLVSGEEAPNKVEKAGFHAEKAAFVDAPQFQELPLTLECEVVSYDAATGHLRGKIVNVSAAEEILGEGGEIDAKQLDPLVYDTIGHIYWHLGDAAGVAYHDGQLLV